MGIPPSVAPGRHVACVPRHMHADSRPWSWGGPAADQRPIVTPEWGSMHKWSLRPCWAAVSGSRRAGPPSRNGRRNDVDNAGSGWQWIKSRGG